MESPGGSQTQQHLKNLIYGQIVPRATLKIQIMLQYLAGTGHSSPRYCGRLPPGRRGLKRFLSSLRSPFASCRLPPGRRGLKPLSLHEWRFAPSSPSPRKAWIETSVACSYRERRCRRLPPGRRGLKPRCAAGRHPCCASPSPRKAWIETPDIVSALPAPRRLPPGRRGLKHRGRIRSLAARKVAFPPEGVD